MPEQSRGGLLSAVVAAALIAAVATGCASESAGVGPSPVVVQPPSVTLQPPSAYDIYRAVLRNRFGAPSDPGLLLVVQETWRLEGCENNRMVIGDDAVWQAAREAFWAETATPGTIEAGRDLGRPYVVLPWREIEPFLVSDGGWIRSHRDYPHSPIIKLSNVGFNPERTRAMVHVGGGSRSQDHYLELQAGQWVVTPAFSCLLVV